MVQANNAATNAEPQAHSSTHGHPSCTTFNALCAITQHAMTAVLYHVLYHVADARNGADVTNDMDEQPVELPFIGMLALAPARPISPAAAPSPPDGVELPAPARPATAPAVGPMLTIEPSTTMPALIGLGVMAPQATATAPTAPTQQLAPANTAPHPSLVTQAQALTQAGHALQVWHYFYI